MGFLKRLLSVGGKKKRKDGQKDMPARHLGFSASTRTLPLPEEQEAVVNRLLRSTSTHFSVISETNYHDSSMPPIPHPINHVLRAPSIMSNATQATDTYRVTVHRRMLHSRTEFPEANRSGSSSSPSRRNSSLPLTPGDKNRLVRLQQDASVLSLLDIYDEMGNLDSLAFSNTPARRERTDSTLHELMGNPSVSGIDVLTGNREESDISWADRYIRDARRDSCSSTSSLGIPIDLFKGSVSPERLRLQEYDNSETAFSSRDIDVGIDSLQVERGTVEDTSVILEPISAALTSPTRRASQFFKFLAERDDPKPHSRALPDIPSKDPNHVLSSPSMSLSKPNSPPLRGPRPPAVTLVVRDGPKHNQTQVSPAPRHRSHPPPLPPVPAEFQSQVAAKPTRPTHAPADARVPFDTVHNAGGSRSVSVASSVHPQIETPDQSTGADPYTPVPPRRAKKGRQGVEENMPPNAPARPVRGQTRGYSFRDSTRPARNKENSAPRISSSPKLNEKLGRNPKAALLAPTPAGATLATPAKNPAHAHLQTPIPPSPASSSELSPHGRQIMASIRAKTRHTPRAWQSWGGKDDPCSSKV